jgi:WD40 repeat protein
MFISRMKSLCRSMIFVAVAAVLCSVVGCGRGLSFERQWQAHERDVSTVVFTPDSKTLITAGEGDDCIRLWNIATGKATGTLRSDAGSVISMAISPCGDMLISVREMRSGDGRVYTTELWDLARATPPRTVEQYVYAVAFSPDSKTMAAATCLPDGRNPKVQLWSLPSLAITATFDRPAVTASLCFSPDGKLLASGEANLELLDVETGRSTRTLKAPSPGVFGSVQFTPDGNSLVSVFHKQSPSSAGLLTWDVETGKLKDEMDFGHPATSNARFSADGGTLAVRLVWHFYSRNDRAEVWDARTGRKLGSVSPKTYTSCVSISPDGSRLAIGFQQPGLNAAAAVGIWCVK